MGNDHVLATDDIGGTQQHGEAQLLGSNQGLLQVGHAHALGAADVQVFQQSVEPAAVLGHVNAVGRGTQDGDAVLVQIFGQRDGCLAAESDHDAHGLLDLDDPHDIFRGQRLKVQSVRRVIVGGNRFRVVVDDDHVIAQLLQSLDAVDGAVIELNALTDAVGAGA